MSKVMTSQAKEYGLKNVMFLSYIRIMLFHDEGVGAGVGWRGRLSRVQGDI